MTDKTPQGNEKSIKSVLEGLVNNYNTKHYVGFNGMTIDQALKEIKNILDSAKPEVIDAKIATLGVGKDFYMVYGRNKGIDEYQSKIHKLLE